MMVVIKTPFVGYGLNMPAPGELYDLPEDTARELLGIGVVTRYETKVDPLPDNIKKKERRSVLSRPGRAQLGRTRKSSLKSATKS